MKGKLVKLAIFSCTFLLCAFVVANLMTGGSGNEKAESLMLAKPAFAQETTAFPVDEAGISAYVNVGQSIDLSKVKNVFRGIEAEGDTYVIGIVELTGLPEEEFPHMYVSSDGWILAYYSKFAPASRIIQWYSYEGGTITTTTLQDAISKICPIIGVNFAQVKGNMSYYHFKYPEVTKMVVAVDIKDRPGGSDSPAEDSFNFSIPWGVTLYEASWSHYCPDISTSYYRDSTALKIDGEQVNYASEEKGSIWQCNYLTEDSYLLPDKAHTVSIHSPPFSLAGAALVFIYR